jgi:uncharacterized hydantoinase/oxoprolinase family protein
VSDPTATAEGRVREVAPEADAVTRLFRVRVGLIDPPPGLALGSAVQGTFAKTAKAGVAVPVAAIVRSLPWRGRRHPVTSELFAQSLDAWLLLGGLAEEPDSMKSGSVSTADGGPATRAAAQRRLARMVLADPEQVTADDAMSMAAWCADRQSLQVARALRRVATSCNWLPRSIVLSGHGGCLARRALARVGWDVDLVSLPDTLGSDVSRAAPAHSLALIARGQLA